MKKQILILFMGVFCLTNAHAEPLRLIQTGENQKQWLNKTEIQQLALKQHQKGFCGGFMDVTDFPELPPLHLRPIDLYKKKVPRHGEAVERALGELSADSIYDSVNRLSDFHNRHYKSDTGKEAVEWLAEQYQTIADQRGRNDIEIELVQHRFKQPSLIVTMKGKGALASEIVVLGGHIDSINWDRMGHPGAEAPGADDDASGSSTVLEVFRSLIESDYTPKRTLQFMAYAGEEAGLLGSQDIARAYRSKNKNVVGVMQFDMTMYTGGEQFVTLITDNIDRDMNQFTKMLIDTYVHVEWQESTCGYACSDHASWNRAGYAAVFPFEASFQQMNKKIHTPKDTLDILDAEFGLLFAKLGVAYAIEMGSGEK